MNFKYFYYLSVSEKLFFFLNLLAFLLLAFVLIKNGFVFGIDSALVFFAILKTHFTLMELGMQRIPVKQQDEKIREFIQQAEKFPWLYKKGGINGVLLVWVIAFAWIAFASAMFKLFLSI